jgi:hypothetical protein
LSSFTQNKKQILLQYRSKNIIASRRAGFALQMQLLLYKKQKTKSKSKKKTAIFL